MDENEQKFIDTIVAPLADTHCGSTVGLAPPRWTLEDGGGLIRSEGQLILWDQFKECAQEIKHQRKKKRLIIPVMGDPIDGAHHDTIQISTPNNNEHARMFTWLLEYFMDEAGFDHRKGDKLLFLRGTYSHVTKLEEGIARDFTDPKTQKPIAIPAVVGDFNKDGAYVHDHMVLNVNGVRFDLAHHGFGVGARAWTRENGVLLTIKSMYWDSLEPPYFDLPDYVIRAHMHQYTTAPFERKGKQIRGTVLPAYQLKTHYGHKVANTKRIASIGQVYYEVAKDGKSRQVDDLVKEFDSTKEVKI